MSTDSTIRKILLLVDGSPASRAAVRLAAAVASAAAARVTALTVVRPRAARNELEAVLAGAAAELGQQHLTVETAILEGHLVDEVLAMSREGFDLAILGARHRERWEGARLSSRLWRIARSVPIPILLVPEVAGETVRTILFCSGGERYIERGARFTAALARAVSASVLYLHVLPRTPELYLGRAREERTTEAFLAGSDRLRRHVRLQMGIFEKAGVSCRLLLEEGDVEEKIFAAAAGHGAGLIAVGSSPARDTLRTYVLGNVTRSIAIRSKIPVLILRSEPSGLLRDLWSIFRAAPAEEAGN